MPDKEYNGYIQSKLKEKICYNNISYSSIYVNVFFSLIDIYYIKSYSL